MYMSNYSPSLPLQLDPNNGFQNNHTIIDTVMQNLKMLVLTSPGERIMDPNFGVGMRRFLFEQNSIDTYSRIRARIKQQVGDYLPFVTIKNITFDSERDDANFKANSVMVKIFFFIPAIGESGVLGLNT